MKSFLSGTRRGQRCARAVGGGYCGGVALAASVVCLLSPAAANAAASAIEIVYSFAGGEDGQFPAEALLEHDGVLYGTTHNGGTPASDDEAGACGTVFGLTLAGAKTFTYALDFLSGCNAKALTVGADGNLYGIAETNGGAVAGSAVMGTAFRITTAGDFDSKLANFMLSGPSYPEAGLVAGRDGSFYGTTSQVNNAAAGTVFRLTPDNRLTPPASVTTLHTLSRAEPEVSPKPGVRPRTALIEDAETNGVFYGTTAAGAGVTNAGTIFRVTSDSAYLLLHSFSVTGEVPAGPLVQGEDGMLYGVTSAGGNNGRGALFRIGTDGTGFEQLHSFSVTADLLSNPTGGLVLADDGNLYGVAGGIFRLDPGTGQVTRILSTAQVNAVLATKIKKSAKVPTLSGLIQVDDGALYGTATFGGDAECADAGGIGTIGCGAVFKVTVGDDGVDVEGGDDSGGDKDKGGGGASSGGGGGALNPGLLALLLAAAGASKRRPAR